MSARAVYLARILLEKMRQLEMALLDDAAPDESEQSARRQELIHQVLLSEMGTVGHVTADLILSAMPRVISGEESTPLEISELSRFLEWQLPALQTA